MSLRTDDPTLSKGGDREDNTKRERIGSLKESKTFQKGGQECLKI